MESNTPLALFTCSIDMHFPAAEADRAVQLLLSAVGRTEAEPGCQACSVARDAAKDDWIRYSETWDSESAFRRHMRSEEFRHVLTAMDMCCEEPRVTIGNLSGHSGMAYLQEMHGAAGTKAGVNPKT